MTRCLVGLALLAPLGASAYDFTQATVHEDDLPLEFWLAGEPEESLTEGYVEEAFELAVEAWREATCGDFDAVLLGTTDGEGGFVRDGISTLSFNDPDAVLGGGVISASISWHSAESTDWTLFGEELGYIEDADIVFNDDVWLGTEEEVESASCEETYSLVGLLVHELGHVAGLAHSCEEGEICEPELLEASMYAVASACDTSGSTPNEDDAAGMEHLMGVIPGLLCVPPGHEGRVSDEYAGLEVELECSYDGRAPERVRSVTWDPGDGTTSSDEILRATWDQAGTYSISACLEVQDDRCGLVERCVEDAVQVQVCATGDTSIEAVHQEGTIYQLADRTDPQICTSFDGRAWSVLDSAGDEVFTSQAMEPVVELELGTYTVQLTQQVLGSEGWEEQTASLELEVVEPEGESGGCSTAGTGAPGFLGLLGLLGLRRRWGVRGSCGGLESQSPR